MESQSTPNATIEQGQVDEEARTSGATEVLPEDECWRLLAGHEVGRLAIAAGGDVDIFPLNYAVDARRLVFRTTEGTKLVEVVLAGRGAFEVDGYEPDKGQAWSVVVKGSLRTVETFSEIYQAEELPLFPWNAAPKERYVRLTPTTITGRRFTVAGTRDGGQPHL